MSKSLIKALKDAIRVILLSLVAFILADGVIGTIVRYLFGAGLNPVILILMTGMFTSVLKGVDRFLHETSDPDTGYLKETGLTGF